MAKKQKNYPSKMAVKCRCCGDTIEFEKYELERGEDMDPDYFPSEEDVWSNGTEYFCSTDCTARWVADEVYNTDFETLNDYKVAEQKRIQQYKKSMKPKKKVQKKKR
jgi:hypothetical protein